jgi:hypothetical protein
MVARHGMPGMCHPEARPVGYGMIGWREAAMISDRGQSVAPQITPFPTGRIMSALYQAFHAWLPSFVPPGQIINQDSITLMVTDLIRREGTRNALENRAKSDVVTRIEGLYGADDEPAEVTGGAEILEPWP